MGKRLFRTASSSVIRLFSVVVKTVFATVVFGACIFTVLHYMGMPVPSASQLLRDVTRMF